MLNGTKKKKKTIWTARLCIFKFLKEYFCYKRKREKQPTVFCCFMLPITRVFFVDIPIWVPIGNRQGEQSHVVVNGQ